MPKSLKALLLLRAGLPSESQYIQQIKILEEKLALRSAELDRWQLKAEDEAAQRSQQAQQLLASRAELARLRQHVKQLQVGRVDLWPPQWKVRFDFVLVAIAGSQYMIIVSFHCRKGKRVLMLTPPPSWQQLELSWQSMRIKRSKSCRR